MKKSYSLAEVAEAHLPAEWTDAERWLRRRLNRGELSGFQPSRGVWRMTDEDVEGLIKRFRNTPAPDAAAAPSDTPMPTADGIDIAASLSPRSRRRLRRAG